MSNSLYSLCLHSYVLSSSGKLELVRWGSGESSKQQGRSGCEAGTHFMALDVSEKYQSQIQLPLENLEISVAFRLKIVNFAVLLVFTVCTFMCVCVYILLLWIFSVLVYILMCLCRVHNTPSPPQGKSIHSKSMEMVANIIKTCGKEAGQKLLLKGSHVHMDILMKHLKDLKKTQGEKC